MLSLSFNSIWSNSIWPSLMRQVFTCLTFLLIFSGLAAGDPVVVDGKTLSLNGTGIRKATFFKFKVYRGEFFTASALRTPEAVLNDPNPKLLRMTFLRNLERQDIVKAWKESFEANNPDSSRFSKEFSELEGGVKDTKEGDVIDVIFHPDALEIVQGANRSQILGPDFSKAILKIWFGNLPPDSELQHGLLGN